MIARENEADALSSSGSREDDGFRKRRGLVSAFLAYIVFVILFGAVVRITGSGAGCGQNWPTCHGEIVHLPRSFETLIELTHRITSGLSLVFGVAILVMVKAAVPRHHLARTGAWLTIVFLLSESLVGAALVLLALVGDNSSVSRAVVMAVHLLNTSFLLGAIVLTRLAITDLRARPLRELIKSSLSPGFSFIPLGGTLLLIVSAFGAVTALGDTLYPLQGEGGAVSVLSSAVTPGDHFLGRLRGIHPLSALAAALYISWVVGAREGRGRQRSWVLLFLGLQMVAGVVNVWLRAPALMQVLHLTLATMLWISWCAFGYAELSSALASGRTGSNAPARE